MKISLTRLLCASLVLCLFSAGTIWADDELGLPDLKTGLVERVAGGQIDWGREMFYAVGEGAVPTASEVPNRAIAVLKAKDYAKMDAIANMRMLVAGTSISYSATGKDYMVTDATLTQKIEGYVKNVVILKTERIGQGNDATVKVTVGCPMYGYQGPGAAILQKASEIARGVGQEVQEGQAEKSVPATGLSVPAVPNPDLAPVTIEIKGATTVVDPPPVVIPPVDESAPEAPPVEAKSADVVVAEVVPDETKSTDTVAAEAAPADATSESTDASSTTSVEVANYTSLIVDTLGLNVMRAMSPKIRTQAGAEVYGTVQLSPDDVQGQGPVAYTRTLEDAMKSSRAGSSPLVVKAIGRAGGKRMCDVVLSDEDVDKVQAAESASKPPFLAAMKVVFVVDPLKL